MSHQIGICFIWYNIYVVFQRYARISDPTIVTNFTNNRSFEYFHWVNAFSVVVNRNHVPLIWKQLTETNFTELMKELNSHHVSLFQKGFQAIINGIKVLEKEALDKNNIHLLTETGFPIIIVKFMEFCKLKFPKQDSVAQTFHTPPCFSRSYMDKLSY